MWQIHTAADARSFERFTCSFSSSVTRSFTSSIAVFKVSMMKSQTRKNTITMYSTAMKRKSRPITMPAMSSIGASCRIVLDSVNIIFRPLLESLILRQI